MSPKSFNPQNLKHPPTTQPPHLQQGRCHKKAGSMPRLSGLQRDVLSLYRRCLRAARTKPADTRPNFEAFARREFAKNMHVSKKDFGTIEFLLRKGARQVEIYEARNITNIAG